MKKFAFAIALAIGAALAGPAAAVDLLGTREVAYGSETDVIPVGPPKRYGAIRICVHVHAVEFHDLDVVFGNGGNQDVPVRRVIPKDDCTRWVNLRGPRRIIKRIVLRYDTWGNSGPRAVITAHGR